VAAIIYHHINPAEPLLSPPQSQGVVL
jgi:hypothetical protein